MNVNLAPTVIKNVDEKGETEMITNPLKMANIFNKYFRKKVETLRAKTNKPPTISPTERLRQWMVKSEIKPPPFKLKPIDVETFRKIMRKMKPKRVHGVDWIDSYSLKISSPLLEESLMHLVNLSIGQTQFSMRWKPQLIFPLHKKDEKISVKTIDLYHT